MQAKSPFPRVGFSGAAIADNSVSTSGSPSPHHQTAGPMDLRGRHSYACNIAQENLQNEKIFQ